MFKIDLNYCETRNYFLKCLLMQQSFRDLYECIFENVFRNN